MSDGKHVVIIGAGIVGVSTAIWLQRAGYHVTLVDREGPASGTSYGNGGVLASVGVVPVTVPGLLRKAPKMLFDPNQPLFVRWSYLPKLLPWLARYLSHANSRDVNHTAEALTLLLQDSVEQHQALAHGTNAENFLHVCDYLYAYDSADAAIADAYGWNIRYRNGYRWKELTGAEFAAYDPAFGDTVGHAYLVENHGRISDPGAYVIALADEVEKQGGKLVIANVQDVEIEGDSVRSVITDQGKIPCDAMVLATGVWSGPLADKLGIKARLESERGYHVELINPSIMLKSPMMMTAGKFVITPMDGRIRAAGIVEFGGLEKAPQQPPFDLLLRQVKAALPGLTYDRVETWMGHRPAPVDSIPLIGQGGTTKNAWFGFGHHHIGLTGGPKTGRILADCISGRKPNIDLASFSPDRFTK
ncbi:MAG: FAD-dependent oxidoreductase [Hyphomicrobiales bacterium]|nr:MAG: FAD-dependent oxidoreductase [Hyphomicrobiales bacterium]